MFKHASHLEVEDVHPRNKGLQIHCKDVLAARLHTQVVLHDLLSR